ncbi:hypothetical protein GQ602_003295 [Ophiocordyceps camponoti-floridani]|uniref:Uncharacterized protein n=1 Tax=Ophiocordyceps camponoti-floridani TaxID=2030778 RepID=A0A8H4Q7X8_9HYPO|nr:hypothetical protein GQ602_003295 [Ophiocordyceps camponoti-floridani]
MQTPRLSHLLTALLCATTSQAKPPHTSTCYEGEGSNLHCYNGKDDTPQGVNVADVAEAAQALRAYGREENPGRFLTMTAANAPDCAEWTIYELRSVLVLAKHVGSDKNSSVLFEDVARTIADEPGHGDDQKPILSCLAAGGSLGVRVNGSSPAYKSDEYKKSGFSPEGIIVKIVSNGRKVDL